MWRMKRLKKAKNSSSKTIARIAVVEAAPVWFKGAFPEKGDVVKVSTISLPDGNFCAEPMYDARNIQYVFEKKALRYIGFIEDYGD